MDTYPTNYRGISHPSGYEYVKAIAAADPRLAEVTSRVREGNALKLPFPDGMFDATSLVGVLEHIHRPEFRAKVIREAIRVLKPGGIFVLISNPNLHFPIDMHYAGLPFVHWLPPKLKAMYIRKFQPKCQSRSKVPDRCAPGRDRGGAAVKLGGH